MTSKTNNPSKKKMSRHHSSPFPACFRPPTTTPAIDYHHAPPPTTAITTTPNLTTCLYQTHLGLFSITWSRSFLARTLHLHLHPSSSSTPSPPSSSSAPSFHLTLKPFLFWSKHGLKKLPSDNNNHSLHIAWDFTHAKFGSGPEPESGYYIAVISNSTTVLFVGDMDRAFHSAMKRNRSSSNNNDIASSGGTQFRTHQSMVVRREHVCGNRFYTTKTNLGGKTRIILIELNKTIEDDPRLVIRFDNKRVIQVKHLKWKFRGSERIEVDGHRVQLSWDVYNWLFDDDSAAGAGGATHDEGYALFTFRFEAEGGDEKYHSGPAAAGMWRRRSSERVVMWSQDSCGLSYERKKMKKKLLVKTRSSSSSSLSSASSSGSSSSVMEWESVEENELKGPTGFSLLVYAWKN